MSLVEMKEAQDGLDAESTKQAELEKLEKLPTSSSENAEEDLTLDEKCWQLMNHVIEKRRSTPRYIEKINKKTVQLEKQLIEERAKRTIASVAPSKSVESHFDERLAKRLFERHSENNTSYSKINDRLDKISKITKQIQNDEIHKIQRAPFDTQTILTRAKKCTSKT